MSMFPPLRAIVNAQFLLVCFTIISGYLMGLVLRNGVFIKLSSVNRIFIENGLSAFLILLVVIASATVTWNILIRRHEFRTYALERDRQDHLIRTFKDQGITDITLPELTMPKIDKYLEGESGFIYPNPNDWVNKCVAKYYGVNSISSKEKAW